MGNSSLRSPIHGVRKPVSGKTSQWKTIRRESNDRETSDMENHPVEKQTLLSTDNLPSTNKRNTNIQSSSSIFSFYENNFDFKFIHSRKYFTVGKRYKRRTCTSSDGTCFETAEEMELC